MGKTRHFSGLSTFLFAPEAANGKGLHPVYKNRVSLARIASTNARLRRRQLVVQEHKGLVSAISNGNGDEAERLAREHSVYAGNDLVTHLERQERARMERKDLKTPRRLVHTRTAALS
jgi:hypothetical protein